jgi:hypothetical protein
MQILFFLASLAPLLFNFAKTQTVVSSGSCPYFGNGRYTFCTGIYGRRTYTDWKALGDAEELICPAGQWVIKIALGLANKPKGYYHGLSVECSNGDILTSFTENTEAWVEIQNWDFVKVSETASLMAVLAQKKLLKFMPLRSLCFNTGERVNGIGLKGVKGGCGRFGGNSYETFVGPNCRLIGLKAKSFRIGIERALGLQQIGFAYECKNGWENEGAVERAVPIDKVPDRGFKW